MDWAELQKRNVANGSLQFDAAEFQRQASTNTTVVAWDDVQAVLAALAAPNTFFGTTQIAAQFRNTMTNVTCRVPSPTN